MAEFTRFAETLLCKEDMRVVSITVKPLVSDCTGRIWFTDLMAQEGDRLTGYVIHTKTLMEKYREDGKILPLRFYNGLVRSSASMVVLTWGRLRLDWILKSIPSSRWRQGASRYPRALAHTRQGLRHLPMPGMSFPFWHPNGSA